jgi:hypothetical protein
MLMPMIMSGTVMATATLAAMISLRIMSSSVCDGAQTVMEGGKALCGVKAARTHQRASLGLWLTISSDHISLGSKHSARCQNLFLALRPASHTVPGPATVTQAETLMPCGARYAYPLPLVTARGWGLKNAARTSRGGVALAEILLEVPR